MDKEIMVYIIYMYIYTQREREYYLVIKNDEILLFVTTWLALKGIILNEIS